MTQLPPPPQAPSSAASIRPTTKPDLVFRQLDEEWVIYDPSGQQLHVLNRTAAVVWLHCDGEHSVRDIVDVMVTLFPDSTTREQLAVDVPATVADFRSRHLLV